MADIRINALATTATTPASDDYLALDGTAQGTRKILATNIANNVTDVILGASGPSVKSSLSARAPRQGLVFDGTAGPTVSGVPAFGTGSWTQAFWLNQSQIRGGGENTYLSIGSGACPQVYLQDTSNIFKVYNGTHVINSGAVPTLGKTNFLVVTGDGTNVKFYVNGVLVATESETVTNYTNAITGLGGGTNTWLYGTLIPLIYNRVLSASEVVALYEAGAPSGADYNSASNTSKLTGANSDFSSAGNWTVTGSTTISGGKLNLSNGDQAYCTPGNISVPVGGKFRVTLTVDSITAGSVQVYTGGVGGWVNIATTAGTFTQEFTFSATSGPTPTLNLKSTGGNAVVDTVLYYQIGLLLAPDAGQAGGGYVWNDQSGNLAQIVLPSSGVQWNLPSVAGQRIRGTTSTNGNQQLLGASVLLPAECQITHVRARARSGTPTITIGTASGGAQIVASVALSTTWLNCTIALTGGIVSSADDIWVGSNSTDVVETDIAFQPLDF